MLVPGALKRVGTIGTIGIAKPKGVPGDTGTRRSNEQHHHGPCHLNPVTQAQTLQEAGNTPPPREIRDPPNDMETCPPSISTSPVMGKLPDVETTLEADVIPEEPTRETRMTPDPSKTKHKVGKPAWPADPVFGPLMFQNYPSPFSPVQSGRPNPTSLALDADMWTPAGALWLCIHIPLLHWVKSRPPCTRPQHSRLRSPL